MNFDAVWVSAERKEELQSWLEENAPRPGKEAGFQEMLSMPGWSLEVCKIGHWIQ